MDAGELNVQARNADIIDFLHKYNGFTFKSQLSAYRCEQHPSLAVKDDRRSWFWHSKGVGGFGAIDFLMKVEQRQFQESVEIVTGVKPEPARSPLKAELPKELTLPSKSRDTLRLYDYLCRKRGIDRSIVGSLLQEGKIYQDLRGNVAFVGHNAENKPRFVSVRGTSDRIFRMDCAGSDKRYGFNTVASVPSEHLYIYESPIDLMSHASLAITATCDTEAWKCHNRLSLSGTSDRAIPYFLNQHKTVADIVLCLDNDPTGRKAADAISEKYAKQGFQTRMEFPVGKDFNEDLIAFLDGQGR